jgi:hypothetical protein
VIKSISSEARSGPIRSSGRASSLVGQVIPLVVGIKSVSCLDFLQSEIPQRCHETHWPSRPPTLPQNLSALIGFSLYRMMRMTFTGSRTLLIGILNNAAKPPSQEQSEESDKNEYWCFVRFCSPGNLPGISRPLPSWKIVTNVYFPGIPGLDGNNEGASCVLSCERHEDSTTCRESIGGNGGISRPNQTRLMD